MLSVVNRTVCAARLKNVTFRIGHKAQTWRVMSGIENSRLVAEAQRLREQAFRARRLARGLHSRDAKRLRARDVAHLIFLCLVRKKDERLSLTALGRQRYDGLPRPSRVEDEADAALRSHLQQARDS
jgi:hypothetical protein